MVKIEWDQKYEVGNFEIDSEHKIFIRIMQKIVCSINQKKNHKHTERLLNEMYKYADFHFYSEETVMAAINYPGVAGHKKEHVKLLSELKNMISLVENDDNFGHMSDFIVFLANWFFDHTANVDKKLADYLKKNKRYYLRNVG